MIGAAGETGETGGTGNADGTGDAELTGKAEETGEVLVDAGAALCPMPVILAARRAAELPAGTVLRVRSADRASAHDLPAWCRMRGHTVLEVTTGDSVEVVLRLGPGGQVSR